MELANTMPDFLMRLVEVIATRRLGKDIFKPQGRMTISHAPRLNDFWIPFFAETAEGERA